MCNLYSVTTNKEALRELARAMGEWQDDDLGNFPPLSAVFPNWVAPVVRSRLEGGRQATYMRWGFPPPTIPGAKSRSPYLTNIRNTDSRYWRPYLNKLDHRCLVPVTSFAEPDNNQGSRSIWTWFARDERRPLMFFAGIWREWEGDRGTKRVRRTASIWSLASSPLTPALTLRLSIPMPRRSFCWINPPGRHG